MPKLYDLGRCGADTRIFVRRADAQIKIETSPVTRGVVHDPEVMSVSEAVEDEFGFAEIQVVSFEDLFGGKLHAALDRQHPRDLYDVRLLYEHEGLTDALFRTFLVYVASSGRPPHELLDPHLIDLDEPFAREFAGMTMEPVSLDDLIEARRKLMADIHARITDPIAAFLLSLHDAEPDFEAIGLPQAAKLPAVRWKLKNLARLKAENPDKHAQQRKALEAILLRAKYDGS